MAKQQTQNPKTETETAPATPAPNGQSPALQKAHQASKAKAEARASLSDVERAVMDIKTAGTKAVKALTTGRGNLYNLLVRNRKNLTDDQKERIVRNLEEQVAKIREAAYGKDRAADEAFSL